MLIEINLPDSKLKELKPLMALLKEEEIAAHIMQTLVLSLRDVVLRQLQGLTQAAVADINASTKPDGEDSDPYIKIKPGK